MSGEEVLNKLIETVVNGIENTEDKATLEHYNKILDLLNMLIEKGSIRK